MKASFLLLWSVLAIIELQAQPVCHFGNINGSNDFVYPQTEVDSTLHLSRYSAIIFGETHTDRFEPAFKFHLLKHLNATYGYRDVFIEAGNSLAWLCNRYLETGDTMFFHPFGAGRKYTPGYMWPGYRLSFWQQLYDYNKALPQSQRFIFHGTDFERKESLAVLFLLLQESRPIPQSLAPIFTDIKAYIADTSWRDFSGDAADRYAHVREAFTKADADVQALYGTNYSVVASIIGNTAKQQSNWRPRNKSISAEIEKAVAANGIKKLVGFYGSAHTNYASPSAIPNQVNQIPAFKGRTLNIVSIYYNVLDEYDNSITPLVRPQIPVDVCTELYNKLLTKSYRATLVNSAASSEKSVSKYADFVLLANDMSP